MGNTAADNGSYIRFKSGPCSMMLIPISILWIFLVAWPLVEMVRVSLTQTNYIVSKFVGLGNYARIFTDQAFLRSCYNSLWYILLMVTIGTGISLTISLLAYTLSKRWQMGTRIISYVPAVSAGVIISQVWKWVYHIDGPLNWFIGLFGAGPVAWMSRSITAIPAVAIVAASTATATVVILLAAMTSIDHSIFDAAKIDGATPRQISLRIVIPHILPMILSMTLIAAIAAPQIFETIYALGPYEHVATMGFSIYTEAFVMSRHGSAAAMSMVMLIAMGGLTYIRQRLSR